MNLESQRVTETKERIKQAFFELYEHKKIEQISIKEITEKAKLNRGTFYVYYKDIYDLLEKVEDELIEEQSARIKETAAMLLHEVDIFPVLPPLEFFQRYSKWMKCLLGENGDPNFIHKIKKLVKINIRDLLISENVPIVPKLDYVLEYVASAQIGMMSYWLNKDMDLPIEEIGDMVKKISLHGPIGFLKSEIDFRDPAKRI